MFDYINKEGVRKRKWRKTGLNVDCSQTELEKKVKEVVLSFSMEYLSMMLGKNKEETDTAIYKRLDSDGIMVIPSDKEYGFTEYLKAWLKIRKNSGELEESTFKGYKSKVKGVCEYFDAVFPNISLSEVTVDEIQKFYCDKHKAGTSANTIRHFHANINHALKFAVKKKLIEENPASYVDLYKVDKTEIAYYNADEIKELLSVFEGDRIEIAVRLAAYLGIRREEVVGLRWSNIDFDNNTVSISESAFVSYGNGKGVINTKKRLKSNSSVRVLPLCDDLKQALLKKKSSDAYYSNLLKKGYCHTYDDYVCTDNMGQLLTRQ